jgi:hypothetical protein
MRLRRLTRRKRLGALWSFGGRADVAWLRSRSNTQCNLPRRLYTLFFPTRRTMPPFVAENPEPGSGGLTVTDEMRRLIAKPGLLTCGSRGEGDGQRLRALYTRIVRPPSRA